MTHELHRQASEQDKAIQGNSDSLRPNIDMLLVIPSFLQRLMVLIHGHTLISKKSVIKNELIPT